MQPRCVNCGAPAVYLRRYTSERLCRSCLITTTLDRIRRTINRFGMLRESDRIAVAVSGGKDSAVLFDTLCRIEDRYPHAEIVPFTIDEGIQGYRDEAIQSAKDLVARHGMPLHIYSFKNLFGHTLDEIVVLRNTRALGACSYCGVLRRRAMNEAAKDLTADVVATGHIMDDEAQTVLLNILRGDSRRIARTNRSRSNPIPGLVPRVKPIMELTERDIVAYAHNISLPYHDVPCPYAGEAYRTDLRAFLNDMEYRRPGTLLSVLRSAHDISEAFSEAGMHRPILRCERCGEPTSVRICKVCTLLEELGA